MREIQAAVLARRLAAEAEGGVFDRLAAQAWMFETRRRFPGRVYEQLFEAELLQDRTHVPLSLTPSRLPVFGPLLDAVKRFFHRLVLTYLDRAADRQAVVNAAVLGALTGVVQTLHQADEAERLTALEQRVQQLEAQLASNPDKPAA